MKLRDLLSFGLVAAALATPLPAQVPGFGDLAGAQGTGDGNLVATPPRSDELGDRVDRLLANAGRLLESSMAAYEAIARVAVHQSDAGRNMFLFKDKDRFAKASKNADALSADLLEVHGDLAALELLLPRLEAQADSLPALERRVEWTRQATLFNTLKLWGSHRGLKFDTYALGDEEKRRMVTTEDQLEVFAMPSSPGVRKGPILLKGRTESLASRYLDAADAAVAVAKEKKIFLARENQAKGEKRRTTMTGWVIDRYTTKSLFDSAIKPAAVEFAMKMARAKANFNAALLATEAPTHGFSEANHTQLRSLMMAYAPLLHWGDYHFLTVENWAGVRTRTRYLFDGGGYRKLFHVETGGVESKHFKDVMAYHKVRAPKS